MPIVNGARENGTATNAWIVFAKKKESERERKRKETRRNKRNELKPEHLQQVRRTRKYNTTLRMGKCNSE
jgi:hypothetical protein